MHWFSASWFALATLLVGATACSLALDFGDECEEDADCAREGAGLTCQAGLCVTAMAPGDSGQGDGAAADGDSGAVDAPDVADTTSDSSDSSDTTAEDTGPPPELVAGTCDIIYGPTGEAAFGPHSIRIGALVPRTGPLDLLGPFLDKALAMAVDEINNAGGVGAGGLVTIVSCDTGTAIETATAAAQHLVDVVGVNAIIGEVSSEITVGVFNTVARPKGVLMLSPAATAPLVTQVIDDGLLWRLAPSSARIGQAIGLLLRNAPTKKIALVHRADPWGDGTRLALEAILCGDPTRCAEGVYVHRSYEDATILQDFGSILGALGAFGPDVVVLISYVQDGIGFVNEAAKLGLKRFLFSDGARDASFIDNVQDTELLCRAIGTSVVPPQGAVYETFADGYKGRFGLSPVPYTANTYDAVYLLTYATVAAGSTPTGSKLATAISRLVTGKPIRAGVTDLYTALSTLAESSESTIDFQGASGPVDFDLETGDVTGDVEAWHFDLDEHRPESLGVIYPASGQFKLPGAVPPGIECKPWLQ